MNTALLLVDVQPAFVGTMHGDEAPLMARLEQLLMLARAFGVPVISTSERPVEQKGELPDALKELLPADAQLFTKWTFDATADDRIRAALKATGCRRFAVAGAETDVCILQTVLGLLREGYEVLLLEDCCFSSAPDCEAATFRMRQAGARPCTYKSFYYELVGKAEDPAAPGPAAVHGLVAPEDLGPR